MSLLTVIIGLPLVAAVGLALIPRQQRVVIRSVSLLATLVTMVLAVLLFIRFQADAPGFQFEQRVSWVAALDISYHVGVDGLNIGLLLMGAVVAFAATCAAWEIKSREKEFYILLLLMTGGILGAFASLDLFFFYFFHELALVPTFIMIGVWGHGERRNYAAFQITLYLTVGALLTLIALIALYLQIGAQTFDLPKLIAYTQQHPLGVPVQNWLFPLLLFGFGILVSLWPFHTWAPLGYAAAPTSTAMIHAGVIKKFGLYGLVRIAVPLLPQGAQQCATLLAWLCLGNIVYCGLVAMRQKDLNLLFGNSSVAHVGFAFLGIASLSLLGITGAVTVMVAHGFLAALLFGLSGYLRQQTGTLNLDEFSGLLPRLPFIGTCLIMAMFAGCGLPGFGNFVGEIMVLFAAIKGLPTVMVLALWGALVIAAIYMLRAIRRLLHGELSEKWTTIIDASNPWRRLPFVLLLACLIVLGCFPRVLTDKIKPSAARIVAATTRLPATLKADLPAVANLAIPNPPR